MAAPSDKPEIPVYPEDYWSQEKQETRKFYAWKQDENTVFADAQRIWERAFYIKELHEEHKLRKAQLLHAERRLDGLSANKNQQDAEDYCDFEHVSDETILNLLPIDNMYDDADNIIDNLIYVSTEPKASQIRHIEGIGDVRYTSTVRNILSTDAIQWAISDLSDDVYLGGSLLSSQATSQLKALKEEIINLQRTIRSLKDNV